MKRAGRPLLALSLVLALTALIIQRYREATISLDYFGDTILNSLSDILACAAGFGLATFLPAGSSVALFTLVESVMLITPLDTVKNWQMRGGQAP